jgi:hypothetical protein
MQRRRCWVAAPGCRQARLRVLEPGARHVRACAHRRPMRPERVPLLLRRRRLLSQQASQARSSG